MVYNKREKRQGQRLRLEKCGTVWGIIKWQNLKVMPVLTNLAVGVAVAANGG